MVYKQIIKMEIDLYIVEVNLNAVVIVDVGIGKLCEFILPVSETSLQNGEYIKA